jgi:DNA invertase Pin-like site-specific DNA recombinase
MGGTKTVPLCLECHGKVHDKDMVRMAHLQRLGMEAARRRGKRWGGSKKGWRWKVTDDQVTAIHEMKAAGKKIAHISRVTGLSRPTIYRVLRQCVAG